MLRRFRLPVVGAALVLALPMGQAAHAEYQPPMALLGQFGPVIPLKNAAMIVKTDGGLRYIAGQQNSKLTITENAGGLLFADTGTLEIRAMPSVCRSVSVATGVAAQCSIPAEFSSGEMYIEIWPRLGSDRIDGSTLSSKYRMWVLADKGRDKIRTGAGRDFVNGAQGADSVWGGAGDDWIRTGKGADVLWGEDGNDKLVGTYENDVIHGGAGDDQMSGGVGDDSLWAEGGRDTVSCGSGTDSASFDGDDRVWQCE